ncbi:GNAT family N-acetyltransferase [Ornithinibacillus sp. BX22]|uniref:GNAT family N-acetyltransferase n=2 Tax=Ornithinibacillus TaxID=484508 RepID=A0A923L4U1_9BACI|nr:MULTISPECIES: GNAT family N-acetyltransferase [Ornithinibacillus]MBC5636495.1 GNAT family N-acetyltransferase [Ornithinibacillus hominis]MBS3680663.1 GNAT family N-acetyltransferase [Ornithinibacillus massiliensis]
MIRLLEPADAKLYAELRLEALQENPEAFSASFEEEKDRPIQHYEERFQQKHYNFGAFDEGKLVGVVSLVPETKLKLKHKANIFAVYVTPSHRGKGVGKALLEAAINQAKQIEGITRINIAVVSVNHEAKALYKRLGFETFGIEEKALKVKNVYLDEEYMVLTL